MAGSPGLPRSGTGLTLGAGGPRKEEGAGVIGGSPRDPGLEPGPLRQETGIQGMAGAGEDCSVDLTWRGVLLVCRLFEESGALPTQHPGSAGRGLESPWDGGKEYL